MILIGFFILCAAFVVWKRESFSDPDTVAILCIGFGVAAFTVSVCLICDSADARSLGASREPLAEAYQSTASGSDEDIAGKVADFNVTLSMAKYWRTVPVIGWMRSSRWDAMEPIQIKK